MWNEKSLHDFALQIERLARFFRFLHRWKCWVFFPSNGMPILRWRHGCWGARRAKGRLGGKRTFPASQPWHTQPCREVALRRTTPTSVIDDFIWNHYLISRSHVNCFFVAFKHERHLQTAVCLGNKIIVDSASAFVSVFVQIAEMLLVFTSKSADGVGGVRMLNGWGSMIRLPRSKVPATFWRWCAFFSAYISRR